MSIDPRNMPRPPEPGDVMYAKHRGFGSRETAFKITINKVRKNGWIDATSEGGNPVTYTARGEEVGTGKWGYGCLIDEGEYNSMIKRQDARVRYETVCRMASDLAKWDGEDKEAYLARIDKFRAFVAAE